MTLAEVKRRALAHNQSPQVGRDEEHEGILIKSDRIISTFETLTPLTLKWGFYKIGKTRWGSELVDLQGKHWLLSFSDRHGFSYLKEM
ncbi:MAG: hypothetical protein ACP5JH_11965 [Bacteroidota bacterium]